MTTALDVRNVNSWNSSVANKRAYSWYNTIASYLYGLWPRFLATLLLYQTCPLEVLLFVTFQVTACISLLYNIQLYRAYM